MRNKIAYLDCGRKVEVVGPTDGGILVRLGWTDYDTEEEWFDGLRIVQRVFDDAPSELYDKKIAALEATRKQLHEEVSELQSEMRDLPRRKETILKDLAKHPGLELLDDYLNGRITHLLQVAPYTKYRLTVLKMADLKPAEYGSDFRMFGLVGSIDKGIRWAINAYTDGSFGNWSEVIPFTSEDAAVSRAREILGEAFATFFAGPFNISEFESAEKSAVSIGMDVPSDLCRRRDVGKLAMAEKSVAEQSAKLAAEKKALDGIRERLAKFEGATP